MRTSGLIIALSALFFGLSLAQAADTTPEFEGVRGKYLELKAKMESVAQMPSEDDVRLYQLLEKHLAFFEVSLGIPEDERLIKEIPGEFQPGQIVQMKKVRERTFSGVDRVAEVVAMRSDRTVLVVNSLNNVSAVKPSEINMPVESTNGFRKGDIIRYGTVRFKTIHAIFEDGTVVCSGNQSSVSVDQRSISSIASGKELVLHSAQRSFGDVLAAGSYHRSTTGNCLSSLVRSFISGRKSAEIPSSSTRLLSK